MPDYRPCPQTNLVDSGSTFPVTRAIVSTNGNNSTGVAAWPGYWATNTSPPAFADIGGALTAIAATNNARHSFNHLTAGKVYLNEGNHTWLNTACTITTGPRTWVSIQPNAGATSANVVISAQATDTRCTNDRDLFLFDQITFNTSGALFVQENVWMDRCLILNLSSSSLFQTSTAQCLWFITRSTISNLTQGIRSFSTQRLAPALVRGNRIVGNTAIAHFLVFTGNEKTVSGSDRFILSSGFAGGLLPKGPQIASYNACYNLRELSDIVAVGTDTNFVVGVVMANNLFEQTTNNTASTAYGLAYKALINFTNFARANNDFLGTKIFDVYDEPSTNTASYRELIVTLNEIASNDNVKGDLFSPISGVRIGNWPTRFGMSREGNAFLETTNVGAFGSFPADFHGINSWMPRTVNATGTNYAKFINPQCHDGSSTFPGGGNYRLLSHSPLFIRNRGTAAYNESKWVLSHDLDGKLRSEDDPPGVYVAGQRLEGSAGFE